MHLQPKDSPARTSTPAVFGVLRSNTPHKNRVSLYFTYNRAVLKSFAFSNSPDTLNPIGISIIRPLGFHKPRGLMWNRLA